MDMDERDRPPPYNEGFTNAGYGKLYMDAEEFKPIITAPQPQAHQQPPYPPVSQVTTPVVFAPQPQPQHTSNTNVIVVGNGGALPGCPVCHNGSWTGTYSCCAWLWCICCFPVGIVCCLCMRRKKCTKCGYTVG